MCILHNKEKFQTWSKTKSDQTVYTVSGSIIVLEHSPGFGLGVTLALDLARTVPSHPGL